MTAEENQRTLAQLLLVDDDQRLADMVQSYLGGNGYRVQLAPHLAAARPMLAVKNGLPDLVGDCRDRARLVLVEHHALSLAR